MTRPLTLPTTPPEHEAMDFALLRAEGIRHLERMAGELWTDYNAHDPGITILEQLCYAITDLGYRIAYELPDLLAGGEGDPYESLYTAADILTSEPVTLIDLRKLVLDVQGVKNAWIERAEPKIALRYHEGKQELQLQGDPQAAEPMTAPVQLKGLYHVLIETSDLADIDGSVVERETKRRLHAHRNLCEDFEEIRVLVKQNVQVHARIEIGPVDDAEEVLLGIYEKIAHYISPGVPFLSVEEMIAAGKSVDEIFDGPRLAHGFVDSETLQKAARKTAIHTSDLINEIMAVSGVRAIRDISVSAGPRQEAWALDLDLGRTPKFDLPTLPPTEPGSTITLEKEQLTVSVDLEKVLATYHERRSRSTTFRPLGREQRDLVPPTGRDRRLGNYDSIQHQFPALYGIGEIGLPDSAPPERKAQTKQLKAYLMFFDQLLANYFAQLAGAKELFSFFGDGKHSYFFQMINDPTLGLEDIRTSDLAVKLEGITQNPDGSEVSFDRKNRFLNHLMARFAEQFTDYSLILFDLMPKGGISPAEKLVHDKQAFLRNYPRISSARGTAFNSLLPWDRNNRSGLEDRIRLKLGLDTGNGEEFYVVEHILLRPMEADKYQEIPLLAAARSKDPYSLQLSFVFPTWPSRFGKVEFRQFIEQTVREETPAHLTPYVHWLGRVAMNEFESAYEDWLEKRAADSMTEVGL